jgi:hypothetical protein
MKDKKLVLNVEEESSFLHNVKCPPTGATEKAKEQQQESLSPVGARQLVVPSSFSSVGGTPYTMLMGIQGAQKQGRLFESPLDPLRGKNLSLFGVPPHCLLRYTSTKGEPVPPEHHLQSIRDMMNHHGSNNTNQLFVPTSVLLEDGREMIGLWIDRGSGNVTPQYLGHENALSPRSRPDTYAEDRRNPSAPSHMPSESSQSTTASMKQDTFGGAGQQLERLESLESSFLHNVPEHAPPPLSGEGVETEPLMGGCCVSPCSASCLRLEIVDSKDGAAITWVEIKVGAISRETVRMVKAFEILLRDLQYKEAKSRPNSSVYLLQVVWPDGSRSPSQSLAEWTAELEGELR